jgi:hypothetical protein
MWSLRIPDWHSAISSLEGNWKYSVVFLSFWLEIMVGTSLFITTPLTYWTSRVYGMSDIMVPWLCWIDYFKHVATIVLDRFLQACYTCLQVSNCQYWLDSEPQTSPTQTAVILFKAQRPHKQCTTPFKPSTFLRRTGEPDLKILI